MTMGLHIRPAALDDYDAVCALLDEVDALHRDRLPAVFRRPAGPVRERAYWQGLLADERTAVFVAVLDGRPAGVVIVLVRETPPIPLLVPRRLAFIDTLAVRHSARRAGIGRALVDTAAAWGTARGAGALQLEVYEFNQAAIDFYTELGFETFSRRLARALPAAKGETS